MASPAKKSSPLKGRKTSIPDSSIPKGVIVHRSVDATLSERGNRYGVFEEHARITQNIKDAMKDSPNWKDLSPDKKEALEMTAHKIGRILNGDPEYADSWHDIQGYCKLVEDTLPSD